MTHDFPTLQEVIAMHDTLIAELGGSPGLRDEAALISALDEAYAFFMELFDAYRFRFAELVKWLEEKVQPLPACN